MLKIKFCCFLLLVINSSNTSDDSQDKRGRDLIVTFR